MESVELEPVELAGALTAAEEVALELAAIIRGTSVLTGAPDGVDSAVVPTVVVAVTSA